MEKESKAKRRPIPPPIPTRNPNTCLSRTSKLNHRPTSAAPPDNESPRNLSKKPNYYHQSATLPNRRHQKLDVCTELLNYISELTQELMAETSFTEVSLFEDGGTGKGTALLSRPPWPYIRSQSSVAIQTEKDDDDYDLAREKYHLRRASEGHHIIGVQAAAEQQFLTSSSNETVVSPTDSNRPFKEVRKMLKEGSIEGIEDDPPVFKPPPPPVTPPPLVQMVRPSNALRSDRPHLLPNTSTLGSQVRRCLSTFEPSNNVANNNNRDLTKTVTPRKKKVTLNTVHVNKLFVEPMITVGKDTRIPEAQRHHHHKQAKTSNFASKSATVDNCIRHCLSPAALEKQRQGGTRTPPPPPPPTCKEPPPKIVVAMPTNDKHKTNATCSSACSCLCLKRRSPCNSPVPSTRSSLPSVSPPHTSPVASKTTRGNDGPIQQRLSPDAPVIQQEAYNALIAEIRAAIKQRQDRT